MRVLVTGGAGYIGSHVVRALQKSGHRVVVIDDLSTGHSLLAERTGVDLVHGDVGNQALLEQVFTLNEPDAVIHIAGRALVGESTTDPADYYRVNVTAGHVLLEAMRRFGVGRIVFSSTCAVYGVPDVLPITEQQPRLPVSPYGASKLAFEHMLAAYTQAYDIKGLALRYFNVAGASAEGDLGELHDPETHLIPNLLKAALSGAAFKIFGTNYPTRDGTAERDYLHVEDLARAHVRAIERLDIIDPLGFGGALNLGTGCGATVREVLDAVRHELGVDLFVQEVPRRAGDPPALVADPTLAQRVIGFHCEHDLGSMIRSAHRFALAESDRSKETNHALPVGESMNGNGKPKMRFGEVAVSRGYLKSQTVESALALQRDRDGVGESHKLLGLILLEMGAISNEQLIDTLRQMQ